MTATATSHAAPGQARQGFMERHYFLLRRLHSLSGVVPIGAFLFPHLITNSSIVWGAWLRPGDHGHGGVETFQHEVNFIHSLPALVLLEIFVIWLPIAYHAALGVYFARTGHSNVQRYAYQDNWRYVLQRWTGYIGLIFIFMHLSSLRWGWTYGGLMPAFDPEAAASSVAVHLQQGSMGAWMALVYLVGVLALVFHFANGLWTAAITWGLTISVAAQRRWGYVCAAIGLGLAAAGVAAVIGFARLDPEVARETERRIGGHTASLEQAIGNQSGTTIAPAHAS